MLSQKTFGPKISFRGALHLAAINNPNFPDTSAETRDPNTRRSFAFPFVEFTPHPTCNLPTVMIGRCSPGDTGGTDPRGVEVSRQHARS